MAKFLDISARQYAKKLKGIVEFTNDEMFDIAKLFNKNIEDIFLDRGRQNGDKKKLFEIENFEERLNYLKINF